MISANLAQNRLRLMHDVDLYMCLYGIYFIPYITPPLNNVGLCVVGSTEYYREIETENHISWRKTVMDYLLTKDSSHM